MRPPIWPVPLQRYGRMGERGGGRATVAHFERQAGAELAGCTRKSARREGTAQPVRRAWIAKPGSQ